MNLAALPKLEIQAVGSQLVTARFEPSRWIGEGWLGWAFTEDGRRCISGRFRSVNAQDHTCNFIPDKAAALPAFSRDAIFRYLDGYWGDRAELVLNTELSWKSAVFAPTDAMRVDNMVRERRADESGDGVLVPGGWDHEHCAICTQSILPGDRMVLNQRREVICTACHDVYVTKASLAFVPAA